MAYNQHLETDIVFLGWSLLGLQKPLDHDGYRAFLLLVLPFLLYLHSLLALLHEHFFQSYIVLNLNSLVAMLPFGRLSIYLLSFVSTYLPSVVGWITLL